MITFLALFFFLPLFAVSCLNIFISLLLSFSLPLRRCGASGNPGWSGRLEGIVSLGATKTYPAVSLCRELPHESSFVPS